MKALLVHPGTQHAYRLARQLQRHDSLSRFWTGFAYDPEGLLGRNIGRMPASLQRRVAARQLPELPEDKLRTGPLTDLRALWRLRAGEDEQKVMFERNEAFQRRVPRTELQTSDLVVGFDTASWLLASHAQCLGRTFVLDRTIGHPASFEQTSRRLNAEFPEWMEDCPRRLPELRAAEDAEHERASRIVVGSSFARRTLVDNGVPAEKISIAPLGVDLVAFKKVPRSERTSPLRFLFLGILGARKGVPLLLHVWRSLGKGNAELWLAGPINRLHTHLIPDLPGLRVLGKVSRRDLPRLFQECDVLVFPSYFEGFGAVLLEAMAAGLPVIATDATGAPDIMTDGAEGYVTPAGDGAALKAAIQRFLDSPGDLEKMSDASRRCAERNSWDTFGDRWMDILREVQDTPAASASDFAPAGLFEGARIGRDSQPNGSSRVNVVLVHPGTQYSFRLARQLQRHGFLNRFWTGFAYRPESQIGRCIQLLPGHVQRQFSNRRLDDVSPEKIRMRPLVEWRAMRRLSAGEDEQRVMFERNEKFQRSIPEREFTECNGVIGFDTASWLIAEQASLAGRTFILDRSIGHPLSFQRILPQLRSQFPEWAEDVAPRLPEMLKVEDIEHRLAKRIVVPSSFARCTLIQNGVPPGKIVVIPFGVDLEAFRPVPRAERSRPLRFLFVGTLSARKGLPLLLDAWRTLSGSGAELWLVGSASQKHAHLIPSLDGLRCMGKVPHRQLPALMRQCDVLVFPSYFEGLAQVQLEGLASGLPLIGTEASGATDLIVDGKEGYIVPVGDAEALCRAMEEMIDVRDDLAVMSEAARMRAEAFSWNAYGDQWKGLLEQTV